MSDVTEMVAEEGAAGDLTPVARLTHRGFLKALAAAIGGAAVGHAVAPPGSALATYNPPGSTPDTVDTNLTVNGNLVVQGTRNGVGTATPLTTLDLTGDVRVNGVPALDTTGKAVQTYYAPGPPTASPPASPYGTWRRLKTYTWSGLTTKTWADVQTMNGTWNRVNQQSWGGLASSTWAQIQNL